MTILSGAAGAWTGANGFRLMPQDQFAESPATLTLATAAGGHMTTVAYTWAHPTDGPQQGLLALGAGTEPDALVGLWSDSWHQQPAAFTLPGTLRDGAVAELEADYGGGWRWRIIIDATGATLQLRMDNVIPADQATAEIAAGPYPAMLMTLRRG
ncbi:hypothetical protein [Catellatospora sichuanensis]|uniref:hypothetical protein n=1 Tax=Catellatospora sichuanensis TaxID=1969805 RepID=UPI001183A0A6|nr:hypothetical protein [Catellatospora sichuanensis]